jgi:hypothetical protein
MQLASTWCACQTKAMQQDTISPSQVRDPRALRYKPDRLVTLLGLQSPLSYACRTHPMPLKHPHHAAHTHSSRATTTPLRDPRAAAVLSVCDDDIEPL